MAIISEGRPPKRRGNAWKRPLQEEQERKNQWRPFYDGFDHPSQDETTETTTNTEHQALNNNAGPLVEGPIQMGGSSDLQQQTQGGARGDVLEEQQNSKGTKPVQSLSSEERNSNSETAGNKDKKSQEANNPLGSEQAKKVSFSESNNLEYAFAQEAQTSSIFVTSHRRRKRRKTKTSSSGSSILSPMMTADGFDTGKARTASKASLEFTETEIYSSAGAAATMQGSDLDWDEKQTTDLKPSSTPGANAEDKAKSPPENYSIFDEWTIAKSYMDSFPQLMKELVENGRIPEDTDCLEDPMVISKVEYEKQAQENERLRSELEGLKQRPHGSIPSMSNHDNDLTYSSQVISKAEYEEQVKENERLRSSLEQLKQQQQQQGSTPSTSNTDDSDSHHQLGSRLQSLFAPFLESMKNAQTFMEEAKKSIIQSQKALPGLSATEDDSQHETRLEDLQAQLKQMKEENQVLQRERDEALSQDKEARARVSQLERENQLLVDHTQTLKSHLDDVKVVDQLTQTRDQLTQVQQENQKLHQKLRKKNGSNSSVIGTDHHENKINMSLVDSPSGSIQGATIQSAIKLHQQKGTKTERKGLMPPGKSPFAGRRHISHHHQHPLSEAQAVIPALTPSNATRSGNTRKVKVHSTGSQIPVPRYGSMANQPPESDDDEIVSSSSG